MLPRGLFLLAEIATSCLFSTTETPLQTQRGSPAEVSDIRSAGTRLPTSSPGLQLSQGEKAIYQHSHWHAELQHCFLLQRKHFHCSQQKVTPCKPAHHPALIPSEASLCTQRDFRLPRAGSHCEGDSWAAPFTTRTPPASQEQNTAPVSQVCSAL